MIQLQVLNKILETQDASLIVLNNLTVEYFSDYQEEFKYIKAHYEKYGKVPDIETFLSKFPDFDRINVQEKNSYLIEELFKDRDARFIAQSFNKVRNSIMNGDIDSATKLCKEISTNLKQGVALECVDLIKDTSRYNSYVEKIDNFNKYYVKTGLPELDRIIGGWDRNEELATIVARTGQGKTWLLLKFAAAALEQGLNVGIYSGEMSENKVGYRFDTLLGHIPNGGLIHGNKDIQAQYLKYITELPTKYKGSLKVLTPSMINGPAGVNALKVFIEKEKLDILFVDQHSLLEDDKKARTPTEKASNISTDLKNLQVMKKMPIICVSQLNRTKNDDGIIDASQIAMSDKISQDSTIILGIAWDKKDSHIMYIYFVKIRDGNVSVGSKLAYYVDLNKGIFSFIPDEKTKDTESSNNYADRYSLGDLEEDEPF